MLSDHEWKTLRNVERQFLADDPEFDPAVARLRSSRARRASNRNLMPVLGSSFTGSGAVLLGGLMLVVGSPGGALAFAAMTGLMWLAWRHSHDSSRRST